MISCPFLAFDFLWGAFGFEFSLLLVTVSSSMLLWSYIPPLFFIWLFTLLLPYIILFLTFIHN